jgi:hypothetical protein
MNQIGIFDNPVFKKMMDNMSEEDLAEYKRIGEYMYNNQNYEDSERLNNLPPPLSESVAYISEGLKSGLHPKELSKDETSVMKEAYGDKWYEKFDYTSEDMKHALNNK